jgi:hypothetical protein
MINKRFRCPADTQSYGYCKIGFGIDIAAGVSNR